MSTASAWGLTLPNEWVLPWMEEARCAEPDIDPEMFFPVHDGASSDHPQIKAAKQVCRSCPVWRECRAWVLETEGEPYGIAGGLSARERHAVHKRRQEAA